MTPKGDAIDFVHPELDLDAVEVVEAVAPEVVEAPAPAEAAAAPAPAPAPARRGIDAPICYSCGGQMQPSGSCYVCTGCGSTSGCS